MILSLAVLMGALALPAAAAPSPPVSATPGSVPDLEQRLRQAQAAADAAAARFQQATARYESLLDQIGAVESRIAEERQRMAELRVVAQHRAVTAYKSRQLATDVTSAVLSGDSILVGIRRTELLQRANARDNALLGQLRALDEDLGIQKGDLEAKRNEAEQAMAAARAEKAALEVAVADAQKAYDDLVARLAREAESRAAAERAARQALAATRLTKVVTGTPVAGFLCPLHGSFTDDYGDPRSGGRAHAGIDIFAPTGAPVVAVKSGSLVLEAGGAGGNAAYLHADDGNTYYFAHFSGYAGGPRPVSQGEVIGYVGQTGNASTPHLHFEIRTPSGPTNPYPTLAASC